MRAHRVNQFASVLWCLCVVLYAMPAHAYIDPNVAGLVSQIMTPLLVFAAAGVTFFRKRLADLYYSITRSFRRREDA